MPAPRVRSMSGKGTGMPFDVHPAFQHLKDAAEGGVAEVVKIRAKVVKAAEGAKPETTDTAETK